MNSSTTYAVAIWPLAVYFITVLVIVTGMMVLSSVLGQKHKDSATGEPYESGIASTGTAHIRFDVRYYLIAMFFVIFDIESIFIFAWSVSVRELGWAGYLEILIFIGVLMVVLIYLWRLGALDWTNIKKKTHTRRAGG
jgi:NADH-quinone oxidoreductase subunit A